MKWRQAQETGKRSSHPFWTVNSTIFSIAFLKGFHVQSHLFIIPPFNWFPFCEIYKRDSSLFVWKAQVYGSDHSLRQLCVCSSWSFTFHATQISGETLVGFGRHRGRHCIPPPNNFNAAFEEARFLVQAREKCILPSRELFFCSENNRAITDLVELLQNDAPGKPLIGCHLMQERCCTRFHRLVQKWWEIP